jgi:parallel beta-helix repeat protein
MRTHTHTHTTDNIIRDNVIYNTNAPGILMYDDYKVRLRTRSHHAVVMTVMMAVMVC